ncbi:hypothetical protein [Simiduia agarivorans]|uniref:Uncharacterized protein n=1 Tax=Simiduia agarivorans (strain DSM 21679 / JCM 13881 / BCRC 17597 / SA1) TaxID=1117647 RepID=K4KMN7_SIMAS|nr:hypothetical protein [Simiduia agarivorans]AFV00277.1 hypothetical protein M5M_15720 [Simiduia agarivorans SA1 = DSM 21679]
MNKLLLPLVLGAALTSAVSHAAPEEFVYKKPARGAASESKMRGVYDLIENPTGSAAKARLAILTGMLETKGAAWVLEQEGDGYVLARWDYKGHSIFHRIEYTADAVQIKYAGGLDAYECEMLVGDYCYKTHSNYYKYNQSLVKQITRALGRL